MYGVDEIHEESNLVRHARRELEMIGEEPDTIQGYLEMISIFSRMGHSGGSASVFIPTLSRLLSFENLKPLTDDSKEWMEVGEGLWQNVRNSACFSMDRGKTYHQNGTSPEDIHTSVKHDA